tara:strand:- start:142 stop:1569 length:1428 start_codon:yes stop_codon:yes gene_type:complete
MAQASTQKKTSLEPSEVFCAVGLLMPSKNMRELVKDKTGTLLLQWASTSGLSIAKKGITPLDSKFEQMFKNAGTEKFVADLKKREELVANIVAGFSAALGVKNFMKFMGDSVDIVNKVYLTGATWPSDVNDFRLRNEDTGFDYNSSDMVAKVDSETFYGISLKKKKNVKGADPTLINKAYSTFIDGRKFTKQRDLLNDIRHRYFADVVRKAQEDGIINLTINGKALKDASDEEIWEYKVTDPRNNKKKYALINVKGFNKNDEPVELSEVTDPLLFDATKKGQMGLRDYINNDLSQSNNELYAKMNEVIQKNAKFFADSLIDIVLKTQMQTKLLSKNIGNMHFEFALVTGFADFTQNKKDIGQSKLILKPATVIPQHTILCGLANLAGNKKEYLMELDTAQKDKSNAAKIFYNLSKDGVNILELQLRYKGDFKQAPQFFATLSKDFKEQMFKECLVMRSKRKKKHNSALGKKLAVS